MSSMMLQYAVGSEGILNTTNLIKHSSQELQQKMTLDLQNLSEKMKEVFMLYLPT